MFPSTTAPEEPHPSNFEADSIDFGIPSPLATLAIIALQACVDQEVEKEPNTTTSSSKKNRPLTPLPTTESVDGNTPTPTTPQELRQGHLAGVNELVGVATVYASVGGEGKSCTGTLIGSTTVLTAAHCVCTDDLVGSNTCAQTAIVTFRPNPAGGGATSVAGKVAHISTYNPSWTEGLFDDDLATITLDGAAPTYVPYYGISQSYPTPGQAVTIAGYGYTGTNCTNSAGSLWANNQAVSGLESGYHPVENLYFSPSIACPGDSGGPTLDLAHTRVYGVTSTHWYSVSEGNFVTNATTTTQHFNWIKSQMCLSSNKNTCSGWGEPCACSASNRLLWRSNLGDTSLWNISNGISPSSSSPGSRGTDWTIAGTGDFDGDGNDDIAWRNNNGQLNIWRLNASGARIFPDYTTAAAATTWNINGIGDFDNNGRADILWRENTGQLAIWFNGQQSGAAFPGYNNTPSPVSLDWTGCSSEIDAHARRFLGVGLGVRSTTLASTWTSV